MPPKSKPAPRSGNARLASRKRQASNADEQPVKRTRRSTRKNTQNEEDDEQDDDNEQDDDEQDDDEKDEDDNEEDEEVKRPPTRAEKKSRGVKKGPPAR